jgi:hypothetical protein
MNENRVPFFRDGPETFELVGGNVVKVMMSPHSDHFDFLLSEIRFGRPVDIPGRPAVFSV